MNHTITEILTRTDGRLALRLNSGYTLLVPTIESHAVGEVIWIGHEPKAPAEPKGKPLASLLGKSDAELRSVAYSQIICAWMQGRRTEDTVKKAIELYNASMGGQ